jgi:glutamate carboxypeptidase
MPDYLTYFRQHLDEMLAFLVRMVEHESPTLDKAAVDRYGAFLCDAYRALGATVETIPQAQYGDHHRITLDPPGGATGEGGQITVLCHLDTVWAIGELAKRPIRTEGNRMYGPGIYDMKGGTMMVLFALRALKEQGLATKRRVVVLLTSEEEIGSPTSRALIEEEARKSAYVLCVEPPVAPEGSLKTARKGVGRFTMRITGRAAHAGADHAKGISAITELAQQVLALNAFTDYVAGTTVNVGVVRGGTRSNVVPAEAEAEIDLRVATVAEGERVVPAILALQPVVPGATLAITGGLNRPPMERTPGIVAFFERARALGAEFGYDVTEAATGGGSDGQFAAALGIPTLDGLGVNGDGAHADHEHLLTDSIAPRAALIAALLHTL